MEKRKWDYKENISFIKTFFLHFLSLFTKQSENYDANQKTTINYHMTHNHERRMYAIIHVMLYPKDYSTQSSR